MDRLGFAVVSGGASSARAADGPSSADDDRTAQRRAAERNAPREQLAPSPSAKRRDDGTARPRRRGGARGEENADAAAADHAIRKKVRHLADFIVGQMIGRNVGSFVVWCGCRVAVDRRRKSARQRQPNTAPKMDARVSAE